MSADLQPYPAYKPSGIDWLGDVPAHWDVRRLKDWVYINKEVLPETTNPFYEFRYLEIGGVGTGVLIDEPSRIRFDDAPSRARRIVRAGDTIISTVRTYLKAVWFADRTNGDLICSTGFAVLTPRKGTAPKFVRYLAQSDSFTDRVTAESVGIAYPAIAEGRLSSFHVAVPPLAEQAAIARYLDRADERISRAISAKQRLVELLTEQRQAVIHRAVTRGLDADAPLKPSGVEWLGDVPAHWDVRRLSYLASKFGSGITPRGGATVYQETGIPFLRSQNIHFDGLRLEDVAHISEDMHNELTTSHVKPGDVLLNITGASIGRVCSVPMEFTEANVNQHVCIIRPRKEHILSGFLSAYLSTSIIQGEIYAQQSGASREGLTLQSIRSFSIPVPPLAEQAAIARHLDKATADIDAAMENARRTVELLREYRARLVADAVTGRVDVRGAE